MQYNPKDKSANGGSRQPKRKWDDDLAATVGGQEDPILPKGFGPKKDNKDDDSAETKDDKEKDPESDFSYNANTPTDDELNPLSQNPDDVPTHVEKQNYVVIMLRADLPILEGDHLTPLIVTDKELVPEYVIPKSIILLDVTDSLQQIKLLLPLWRSKNINVFALDGTTDRSINQMGLPTVTVKQVSADAQIAVPDRV
jgi:hypothetical protein